MDIIIIDDDEERRKRRRGFLWCCCCCFLLIGITLAIVLPLTLVPQPSSSPSAQPTTFRPTTRTPTLSPTSEQFIYLYSDNNGHDGELGGRSETNAFCLGIMPQVCIDSGNTLTQMFVSYTTSPLVITNPLRKVKGVNGVLISNTFDELFNSTLLASMSDAGINGECYAWTGISLLGYPAASNNCDDFGNTLAPTGAHGSLSSTAQGWFNEGDSACSTQNCIICICY